MAPLSFSRPETERELAATVAVLAGGAGSRIGGDKACVSLAGRPLISYPLQAAARAGLTTVVIAKHGTLLPPLSTPVLREGAHLPLHPLSGIVTGLQKYEAIVAVPCDMPFLTPELLLTLARATAGPIVVASPGQPFPGRYESALASELSRALAAEASLRSLLVAHNAVSLLGVDPACLFSVNSAADLDKARRQLGG